MSTHLAYLDPPHSPFSPVFSAPERRLIQRAIALLERKMFQRGVHLDSPQDVFDFLRVRLRLGGETHEVFAAMFLDSKHCVIAFETLADWPSSALAWRNSSEVVTATRWATPSWPT
ncbi:hypothetical protein [Xanthomonas theicola]|uniref:hypothetical protein n=1 Tax=Xanthomonas theicola TaxID=56464 RepID=UPI000FF89E97|nr:hypothetical protein [Xanthomonas theicola]QNH24115.1 hypothetical protein G4Q83_04190 [Xanthomonas theicola]